MKLFRGKVIKSTKINTSGYCFICLESSGGNFYSSGVSPGIGTLLRYLKINQGSDARDEIEVYLCQSCEKINSRISTLCQQLEKVQMETNYFVDCLHHRISKSYEPDLIKDFSKTMTADPKSSLLQYVSDLRAEISQKSKSMQMGPQLRVNLTRTRLNPKDIIKEEGAKEDIEDSHVTIKSYETFEDSPSNPLSPSISLPSSTQSNTKDISDHSESINCYICGKEFSSIGFKNALEQHRWNHKESTMFQCSECAIKSKISWVNNKNLHVDKGNHMGSHMEPEVEKDTIKTLETTENIKDLLEIVRKEVTGFNLTSNPIDEVDFSEDTSEFKKFVLSTLLKINKPVLKAKMFRLKRFKKRTENMDKNSAEYLLEEFKIQEKFQFFEYEPISKTVRLKNVILEINEQEHFVKCSECQSYRRLSWPRPSNQKFPTEFKRSLMEHILERHLNIFQCRVKSCEDKTKYNSVDYLGHLKGHLGAKHGFECNICGRPFVHKDGMKMHLLTHKSAEERGQKSSLCFQCAKCGKKTKSLGSLHVHEKIHKDRKRTLCPDCGKSVLDLKTHKRMTCTVPTLKCFHCEKMFKTEKERRSHVNRIHSDNSGTRLICERCSRPFGFEKDLKQHIKRVHEFVEKKHPCRGGCGARFPDRYHCKKHERTCKVLKQLSIIK